MTREVCLHETAELETVRVCIPTKDVMNNYRTLDEKVVSDQLDWLRENGTGVFSWRAGSRTQVYRTKSAVFIFSDPDTAMAFKMRWA